MCEQVNKQILFQQCRYLYSRFEEPKTADTYIYLSPMHFVYVELRKMDGDIIIEIITKFDTNEVIHKRRVFAFGTFEYEAIRKAINVYDKLSLDIDALHLKLQQEEKLPF